MTTETLTMAVKLIPYSRFSEGPQEAGDSQRRQDALAEQAAKEEGVPIDWTLSLRDKAIRAFRGKNWKKGNLGKFLDLVDAGIVPKVSILCIERVNRLSRMPWMAQVQLWKEILSRGIIIRTCIPPARYTKKNMDDLSVGCPVVIYMMLGHLESK
jgi:DNA invertase Pin-like site-specific DNA recombinase